MGLQGGLTADEIVAQVDRAGEIVRSQRMPTLRNIVFMGMGEPLDNAAAVQRALSTLVDPRGRAFAPRHITVSTVGPSVRAVALTNGWPGRLAWSLHAADDDLRRRLIQTARESVGELARAFAARVDARNQPLFVEMTLIDGLNDSPEHAVQAARLFRHGPRRVRFNLLPVNPTDGVHRASPPDRVEAFRDRLRALGFFAMIRRPRGRDRRAACGQLVTLVDS